MDGVFRKQANCIQRILPRAICVSVALPRITDNNPDQLHTKNSRVGSLLSLSYTACVSNINPKPT
jgi:hypothetical protein